MWKFEILEKCKFGIYYIYLGIYFYKPDYNRPVTAAYKKKLEEVMNEGLDEDESNKRVDFSKVSGNF